MRKLGIHGYVISVLGALALAGCSIIGSGDADGPGADLRAFALNDLHTASQLAGDFDFDGLVDPDVANGDALAAQCYAYLAGKAADPRENVIEVEGVVSAFQSARNVNRRVGDGLSDEFKIACGPLVMDARGNILRLTGGALLPF